MREPVPPYVGEGAHALWHMSEGDSIESFAPHVSATAESSEPRVWAVDTRHLPLYRFPRECPRGCFWATRETVELRAVPNLWPLWNRVVRSTLEFSGIRLHNALPAP